MKPLVSRFVRVFTLLALGLAFTFNAPCANSAPRKPHPLSLIPLVPNDGTWIGTVDPKANPNTPLGPLELSSNQPSILISRPEYSLSWNSHTRVINWASWVLKQGDVGRTDRSGFKRDDELRDFLSTKEDGTAVDTDEYKDSCFDRGHQVPSKDRTSGFKQNQAVFKMSNMMPQTAFLNRIIWERLEAFTRDYQKKKPGTQLWIIAGPIYTSPYRYIGTQNDIAVPDANFKIVIEMKTGPRAMAKLLASVIMPNVTSKKTDPFEDKATACFEERTLPSLEVVWEDYTASLEEIERDAGLNLDAVRTYLNP